MAVHLHVSLWARPGQASALIDYEDKVLGLMAAHGASIVHRARTEGGNESPLELQLLEFPTEAALDAYLDDSRRVALADERERVIARTEIVRVNLV